jgi:hypothetical protein
VPAPDVTAQPVDNAGANAAGNTQTDATAQRAVTPTVAAVSPAPDAVVQVTATVAATAGEALTQTTLIPVIADVVTDTVGATGEVTVTVVLTGEVVPADSVDPVATDVLTDTVPEDAADTEGAEVMTDTVEGEAEAIDAEEVLTDTVPGVVPPAPAAQAPAAPDTSAPAAPAAPVQSAPAQPSNDQAPQPAVVTAGSDTEEAVPEPAPATRRRVVRPSRIASAVCTIGRGGANQRQSPSVRGKRLAVLGANTRFTAYARSRNGAWVYGVSRRGRGWVSVSTLRCTAAPSRLNVRTVR